MTAVLTEAQVYAISDLIARIETLAPATPYTCNALFCGKQTTHLTPDQHTQQRDGHPVTCGFCGHGHLHQYGQKVTA